MSETWYKEWCPKCETVNWICDGNTMDLSEGDVEAIKCRKCGSIFLLGYEETVDDDNNYNPYGAPALIACCDELDITVPDSLKEFAKHKC